VLEELLAKEPVSVVEVKLILMVKKSQGVELLLEV
jgi:hypothetical protein